MQKTANWFGARIVVSCNRPMRRWPFNQTLLVMKLTIVLLVTFFFQVHASALAQSVTLSGKNLTLEQVFAAIEKQTDYVVFSKKEVFRDAKPVSLSIQNMPLAKLLEGLLKDQPLTFRIVGKNIILSRKHSPENLSPEQPVQQQVTGRITDSLGVPLERVSVRLLPGKKGAFTDASGAFVIPEVEPGNYRLEISMVGYQTIAKNITVTGNTPLALGIMTLRSTSYALEAVSVTYSTGYETISKERATGAFSAVSNDMLQKRPVSNISTALQGLVAGMQGKENEDGSVNFLIRGNSSLYANQSPLVVVDGFPISGSDFSDINPNDIESITVLKDAAAASIWGARSANGVIVVITKKGKGANKLKIEANAFTRISRMTDLNQVLTQANSADQVAYEHKAFDNNWTFFPYSGSFYDITNSLTLAQELLYANRGGKISTAEMNAGLDRLSKINNRSQIEDQLMQHAILNQYNVNFQAGSEKSKTYASVLYEKSKGSCIKNGYNRFNLNLNNDFKIAKFLTFYIGANIQYKKQESSGATLAEIQGLSPYEMLLNPDGSYATNLNGFNREQLSQIPADKFPYADWSYNLLQEVRGRSLSKEDLSARIQAGLNIRLPKGFSFDSKFQYERARTDYSDYYDQSTHYVRSRVNSMTEYNPSTKTIGRSFIPKGGILKPRSFLDLLTYMTKDISTQNLESYLVRNQFNYDKEINNKHSITAIAGMELSQYTTTGQGNPYAYGYSPDKLQATVPPYGYGNSLNYLSDFTGYPAIIPGGTPSFTWERDKYVSYYANASYTYDRKYTLSGSIRSDASNFITDNPKLRWSPLWSLGAKWNIMNENFMNGNHLLDRLEMRLTYGKNGNVERSTSTKALLAVGSNLNATTNTITATIADNGNPNLRWEKTTTTNLGFDFSILKNKVFGSIDLYNKVGKGIVGRIALPAATGTAAQKFNNAGIINRGVEVSLGTDVGIGHTGIHYATNVTYAYNYNRVNDLFYPSLFVAWILGGEFVQGRPVDPIYSLTYLGMTDGVPMAAGLKGQPQSFNSTALTANSNGLSILNYEGAGTPPHTLGWVNSFGFHNFTLTAIFTGKFGGVYRNPTFNYGTATVGSGKTFVNRFVNDVLAGNPNIPGFAKPNETKLYLWERYTPYLSSLVESSSYVECKELTLQYALPQSLVKAIHFAGIKAFVQTRDLGLIWKANKKGYNPDWLPGTNRPVQSYTFGANIQF